jgi:hypothetical protein
MDISDRTKGTVDLGKMFTDAKVSLAVNQIKQLIVTGKQSRIFAICG